MSSKTSYTPIKIAYQWHIFDDAGSFTGKTYPIKDWSKDECLADFKSKQWFVNKDN